MLNFVDQVRDKLFFVFNIQNYIGKNFIKKRVLGRTVYSFFLVLLFVRRVV